MKNDQRDHTARTSQSSPRSISDPEAWRIESNLRHQPARRRRSSLPLGLCLSLTALAPSALAQKSDSVPDSDIPSLPPAMLNEILFDSRGIDGTADLGEFVEILVLQDGVDLSTLEFTDHRGNSLGSFPKVDAAQGAAVVLCLGPDSFPYIDSTSTMGSAAFASGKAPADYLDNHSGGVRLIDNQTGQVVDAFYWGRGTAPSGAGVGPWAAGDFFDTSLATGTPVLEGQSVGRHAYETRFPGAPEDWASHGGPVAAHPSPARSNDLMHANVEDLLLGAQQLVNDALIGYGDMQFDYSRYSITASSVKKIDEQRNSPTHLLVVAEHSFTIEKHGVASIYKGVLNTELDGNPDPDSLSYDRIVTGTLVSDDGDAISVEHVTTYSGFASGMPRTDYGTQFALVESGVAQWFEISGFTTLTTQTDDQWLFTEQRDCRDYLDPSIRTVVSSNVIDRLGDGRSHSFFTVNRPFPSGPTPPTGLPYSETIVMEMDSTIQGNGSSDVVISRFEATNNGQVEVALQQDQVGSMSLDISAAGGQYFTDFEMNLPVEDQTNGVTSVVSSFMNRVDGFEGDRYVASGKRGHRSNGMLLGQNQFYVDPPVYAPQGNSTTVPVVVEIVDGNGNVIASTTIIVTIVVLPPPPPAAPMPAPPAPAPPRKTPGETLWEAGGSIATCALSGAGIGSAVPVVGNLAGALIGAPVCGSLYAIKRMLFG